MLVDTAHKFNKVLPDLLACPDPVVDTETTGLNPWGSETHSPDRIIGLSIDTRRNAYYFPYRHKVGKNLNPKTMEFFRGYLGNRDRVIGGHNYKFDMHMLYMDGVPYNPHIEDSILSAHLLNENEPSFKLKELGDKYIAEDSSSEEKILLEKVGGRKDRMNLLLPSDVEPYACNDVKITRALLDMHKPALQYWGLYDIWQQINYYEYISSLMENRGMLLDVELIHKYADEASTHLDRVMHDLEGVAKYKLNPNSSKQVCSLLGIKSSAAEILEVLAEGGNEIASLVMLARGWGSVKSRYYTPYLNLCDTSGVLRTSLNLHGTISGRLSSSNPNLQAVARQTDIFKVKDVFIARPGYTLVSMDYAQAEMRLACFYSKEETMAQLIRNGADIHSSTAEELNIPRDAAKRINFGVIYGIGAPSLSKQLHIPQNVASGYLKKYHSLYPQFKKLYYACQNNAEKNGYIRMWTGRMRHYNQSNPSHKAMSNLIQGGIAEVMRTSITRCLPVVNDLNGYMLLQVHDQIIFEIPDENVKIAIISLKDIMEDFEFDPVLTVDVKYGKSWGGMVEWVK